MAQIFFLPWVRCDGRAAHTARKLASQKEGDKRPWMVIKHELGALVPGLD